MHQSDGCAGPAHQAEQAQPLNPPPRTQEPDVDLMSPTFGSVAAAVTNLRILRADRQIEWLSIMRDMHGPRAARQSMPTVRVRLPLANVGAAALACASRQAQAAIIITCARPHVWIIDGNGCRAPVAGLSDRVAPCLEMRITQRARARGPPASSSAASEFRRGLA